MSVIRSHHCGLVLGACRVQHLQKKSYQKVQEGNFGRRRFFSHLILEEGVASKRALRSISFIFIIILKIHLTNTFEKSSHIYTNSTRRLYMINTMTSKIKFLTLVAVSVLFHKPVNNEIFPVHIRYKGTPTRSVSVWRRHVYGDDSHPCLLT